MSLLRLTVLLAISSVTALANTNPPTMSIVPVSENVYNVYFKSSETEKVKVSIVNNDNQVVFTERITMASFKRPYNFSNLAYGKYKVIIAGSNGVESRVIDHVSKQGLSTIRVSVISKAEGKFAVRISQGRMQPATIRIYDSAKGLIFNQQVDVNGSFGQVFNVSKARSSEDSIIMFEVTSNGKVETALF